MQIHLSLLLFVLLPQAGVIPFLSLRILSFTFSSLKIEQMPSALGSLTNEICCYFLRVLALL